MVPSEKKLGGNGRLLPLSILAGYGLFVLLRLGISIGGLGGLLVPRHHGFRQLVQLILRYLTSHFESG